MRTQLLLTSALLLGLTSTHAQIPNAGFETWADMGDYFEPNQWTTENDLAQLFGMLFCTEGTPGHPGASYVKLTTLDIPGFGPTAGKIISGNGMSSFAIGGFPFAERPAELQGSWMCQPVGLDLGAAVVVLTKWNPVTQERDLIGGGDALTGTTGTTWINFAVEIFYSSPDYPDTATITLMSSLSEPETGSELSVDDLHFAGAISGIAEADGPASMLNVYPSPATDHVQVDAPADVTIIDLSIWSLQGRLIDRLQPMFIGTRLDVGTYAPGTYVVQARLADGRTLSHRFLKQ